MALIETSSYRARLLFQSGHFQTIYPTLFRRVGGVHYQRERLELPDGDFIDLDWEKRHHKRLAIISHGLEGDSRRCYVLGMVRALTRQGWDALAWNARGCSGEINRLLRFTHSGATEDLDAVVQHVLSTTSYTSIALVGFSLGGNLTLKYLGERGASLSPKIQKGLAFSVPCHLTSGSIQLARAENWIYMKRFLVGLRKKIQAKMKTMPGQIDDKDYHLIRTFEHFDDRYTAPIHGFRNARDYWEKSSSRQFLTQLAIPTLLINARNDPFLSPECFPCEEARQNHYFHLEMPLTGGHTGFVTWGAEEYWMEKRAVEWLNHST